MDKFFEENGIEVHPGQVKDFEVFHDMIIEANKKIDITNITETKPFYIKHILDSIYANKSKVIKDGMKMIDIGTGGGFPAIPLKIIYPNLRITLLDSLNKRIRFLDEVIDKMKFEDLETIHGRAEELARNKKYREKYDLAISRAVARMATLVEYCMGFVEVGGYFIAMKGPNYKEELDQAKNAIDTMGGKIKDVIEYELPDDNGQRTIIVIEKIRPTPKKYPRGQGKPRSKPL